jgi:hypothetical protein
MTRIQANERLARFLADEVPASENEYELAQSTLDFLLFELGLKPPTRTSNGYTIEDWDLERGN